MLCEKGLDLKVHSTPAGYYIGTWDKEGPMCRISIYFKTRELAEAALLSGAGYIARSENIFICPMCGRYGKKKGE